MKISVILPVRNPDPSLLNRALDSIYEQTYSDYEILLVNDGSDTLHTEGLRAVAEHNSAVRLFVIEPSGVSAARNLAADMAEGEILTYLDADDFLSPVCFEEAVRVFENTDVDAVWGGTLYGPEEELLRIRGSHSERSAYDTEELRKRLLIIDNDRKHISRAECIGEPCRFENGIYISRGIAGRFIRKDKLAETGIVFPQGIRYYEDAIWNLKMLDSMKVAYLDSEWYYYLENEASVSNSYNPDMVSELEDPLAVIRKLIDMNNKEEYAGYTGLLMDSLRYVSRCLLNNPKWTASSDEKRKLEKHLYREEPWREIGTDKYRIHARTRDCRKAALYRKKLLLFVWKYK
ncbi:MAG: glycosyltransferase family 2 protein [Parasporobacterium sp.]|nr:glycosyltransferase family 2 protein [Parasporobacterium sp.]